MNKLFEEQHDAHMKFYVPLAERNSFNYPEDCIIERRLHKYVKPFLWDCKVWHAPFQSGRMIPKDERIKVLLTIHDLNALHEDLPLEEKKKSLHHTQKLINRSNAIVCISEFCKTDVLANCEVGNKPVYVIHNGIHAVEQAGLSAVSYKPKLPFLFAMGDVNRKKNFHTLTSLMQYPDMELVIAGRLAEEDYIAAIKKDAEVKGISERLHILGPVREEEKSWYLQNCTAFVHPSLAEGFGATVVEAMSFGKPLFLSRLTSLPEIGADVAFYFNNFEAEHMTKVLADGLKQYHSNGLEKKIRERSTQFNWEKKAREYMTVYQTLLQ